MAATHVPAVFGAASPRGNTYAFIFLVRGAVVSALRYRRRAHSHHRVIRNARVAVGALLPGIGGTATRTDYREVLYATEVIGLSPSWRGYRWNVNSPLPRPSRESLVAGT